MMKAAAPPKRIRKRQPKNTGGGLLDWIWGNNEEPARVNSPPQNAKTLLSGVSTAYIDLYEYVNDKLQATDDIDPTHAFIDETDTKINTVGAELAKLLTALDSFVMSHQNMCDERVRELNVSCEERTKKLKQNYRSEHAYIE